MTAAVDPNEPVLTPAQQLRANEAEAERKAAEDKALAVDAANLEFQKDVAAANAKRNEALAQFPDLSIAGIAEAAWNAVRGTDPAFNDCIQSHREKLLTHADAVQRTGVPIESPSDFEVEVGRLLDEQKSKAKVAVAASVPTRAETRAEVLAERKAEDARAARADKK